MVVTCSYKNKLYEQKYKIGTHYGVDFAGDRQMYASGNGIVLDCGYDNCFGNFIIIKYDKAVNHKTNKYRDVIFRYFHLASLFITKGQQVNKDTKLGIMGTTGKYSDGIHCHLECDTDCRLKYCNYTPTLKGNTNRFKAGIDTTLNPMDYIHCEYTKPDNQKISRTQDMYTSLNDVAIPKIK